MEEKSQVAGAVSGEHDGKDDQDRDGAHIDQDLRGRDQLGMQQNEDAWQRRGNSRSSTGALKTRFLKRTTQKAEPRISIDNNMKAVPAGIRHQSFIPVITVSPVAPVAASSVAVAAGTVSTVAITMSVGAAAVSSPSAFTAPAGVVLDGGKAVRSRLPQPPGSRSGAAGPLQKVAMQVAVLVGRQFEGWGSRQGRPAGRPPRSRRRRCSAMCRDASC